MQSIQRSRSSAECTLNIVPCRIHHNGPTKITKRYWRPHAESDGTYTAHFRGRRLRGKQVQIPDKYHGLVLKSTKKLLPIASALIPRQYDGEDSDENEPEDETPEPVKVTEEVSKFQEMVVWGHDQLVDTDDTFIKGVEEWISLAEAIHGRDVLPIVNTSLTDANSPS